MELTSSFEFRELEVFVAVVRTRSMTGAAQILGLSQPAISQTIKNLEENLKVILLDRHARPIRPTAEGDNLFHAAQQLLEQQSKVMSQIRERNPFITHRLNIAIVDSLSGNLVPKVVERMRDQVGRWQFSSGLTSDGEHAFSTGKCDLAIVAEGQATTELHIDQHLILKEPFLKIFPRNYDDDVHDIKAVTENLRFVRFTLESTAGRSVEQHLNRLRLQLPLWVESDSPMAQMELIASGTCWGYLTPTFLLSAPHLLDKIQVVTPRGPNFFRRILLLGRHGQLGSLPETLGEYCRLALIEDLLPPLLEEFPWASELMDVPGHRLENPLVQR